MRATDVMTTHVITVDPDATVRDLATLLAERGISGAPVVGQDGRLVGIISEGDLLHRAEIGTARRHRERRRSWWLDHFASDLARDYVKSHGRTVKDIMTRDVVTVSEDTDLGDVAALLEARRIKRVPVMREGKVVGIISRPISSAPSARPRVPHRVKARAMTAQSARSSSPSSAVRNGRRSGPRTSSYVTARYISGFLRMSLRKNGRPCASRRRQSPASVASRNTSCPLR
jgi:CBS domain-containing protein